jgi:predicted enzyme related to lactoylglutathione lyase
MTDWYQNVLGLPLAADGSGGLLVGGAHIYIDRHSETSGPTKEPTRVLINMFVDDLEAEQARLEAQGVSFIRRMGREEWGGVFSTFSDPDGNLLQIAEFMPDA